MNAAKIAVTACRIGACGKFGGVSQLLKNLNRMIFACDISWRVKIGDNFQLPHQGLGVVIGPGVEIGDNVLIYQNVTLGGKNNYGEYVTPKIGNNVMIGAGTKILGNVHVGDNVIIGANSVVLSDVQDGYVVAGIPAKVIKKGEPI